MKTSTCALTLWMFVTAFCVSTTATQAAEPTMSWIRQWGTSELDSGQGVAADGQGSVYVTGYTAGTLAGTNFGDYDAFLSKHDAAGTLLWTQQLGTTETDRAFGVSTDGFGNVYIAGSTEGSLGGTNAGYEDAFVSKFDASGTLLWTQQWGASGANGVSSDGLGNIYVLDNYINKHDASGTLLWRRQLNVGEEFPRARSVSADGLGSVYVAGAVGRSPTGYFDGFLSKYDAMGTLLWTQQGPLGTDSSDAFRGVSADGLGNVYVAGSTSGDLAGANDGEGDAILGKYDASGNLLWIQQWGTSVGDSGEDVSADGQGNVYVSGHTFGSLGGPNAGGYDTFVSKFDDSGTLLWSQQWRTARGAFRSEVSADGQGSVYVAGTSDLGWPTRDDIFLAKLSDVAEPTGDFDENGELNAADMDLLSTAVRDGPYDQGFDLNLDTLLDEEDRRIWVEELAGTFFGDADLDQTVQFNDFVALADAFGIEGGWAAGDFNGDGTVQFPDFVLLADNFGKSAGGATLVEIPEPSGFSLALIVGLVLIRVGSFPLHRE